MKIEIEVADSIAQDALDNAWETGIAYWMNEDGRDVAVENSPNYGREDVGISEWRHLKVTFRANIDGKGMKSYEVTAQKMMKCLGAFMTKYPHLAGDQYLGGEYDSDATSDDAWFQFTAFGDVVYG